MASHGDRHPFWLSAAGGARTFPAMALTSSVVSYALMNILLAERTVLVWSVTDRYRSLPVAEFPLGST